MANRGAKAIPAIAPVDLDAALNKLGASIVERMKEREELLAALREISEGRGRFSLDNFTHARNTIEDMKQIALDAIAKAEGK